MQSLSGLVVLEFSRVLAGPWCGMMLADLGATVLKIEGLDGDDTRGLGPPFKDGLSAYFACCNRNKQSLAIDLRHPLSRKVVEGLVRQADVLIESYRTGVAETLGLGYAELAAINPRLVYCAISGYGRTGPDALRPGYDFVVQAESGLMSITGPAEGEPSKVGVAVADLATGQNAAIAILAALRHRDATGQGQYIDLSLFDTQLSWLANVSSSVLFSSNDAARYGNSHSSIVPYQAFAASDGDFVLTVASEKLWRLTCNALGRSEWIDHPDFHDNAARVRNRVLLCNLLIETFAGQTVQHWLDVFSAAGVPAAPIRSVAQALGAPLTQARVMTVTVDGVPMVASPLKLSSTPVQYRLPPPKLGEHGDEIVRWAGGDPQALRDAGAMP